MYNSVSAPRTPVTLPDITLKKIWKVKADFSYTTSNQKFDENSLIAIITLSGKGFIKAKEQDFYVESGKLLIIKGNDILYYKTYGQEWNFYWFEFSANHCLIPQNTIFGISDTETVSIECEKCYIELSSPSSCDLATARFCFVYLSVMKENKDLSLTFAEEIIEKAKLFINMNINSNFTIADVAAHCHISERYLNKLFNQTLGISPKKYVLQTKINLAAEMLKHTNMKIFTVAEMIGFEDPYYFDKIFKKYTGFTPSELRKQPL